MNIPYIRARAACVALFACLTVATVADVPSLLPQATGGAAAVSAASVRRVAGVSMLDEFGAAEAVWHFDVENFTGVVAMDSHGVSLFDSVRESSRRRLAGLFGAR